MKSVDPGDLSPQQLYALMTQVIVPRPIAWISTVSASGVPNLAPFSFFNGVSARPPILSVAIARARGGEKDTLSNIRATKELVVNVVTRKQAEAMVQTSAAHPPEVDEFAVAGLGTLASVKVAPPRVAGAPIHLECVAVEIFDRPGGAEVSLVLGRILRFHVARELLEAGEIDPLRLDPVGRLGGTRYASLGELFDLPRPD